jgi:hypothetical protein
VRTTLRRSPKTLDELKHEVRRVVERPERGTMDWRMLPCVYRVARIRVDGAYRLDLFTENVVLPDVKHTLELVIEMLNHIRLQRGLEAVRMPIFVHPDEAALELRRRRRLGHGNQWPEGLESREESVRPRRRRRRAKKLRIRVLDRDDNRCTSCGAKHDLLLHRRGGEEGSEKPDDYVTLCRRCFLLAEGAAAEATLQSEDDDVEELELPEVGIRSQLALVLQKGSIEWVGFVFGRDYVLLKN